MRLNVLFREEEPFRVGMSQEDAVLRSDFGSVQTLTENDYNSLLNKPRINSVVLTGSLTAKDLALGQVLYDTTAAWDGKPYLIAEESVVYIYSDYQIYEDESGNQYPIAGIKIGDGTSHLIDIPFVTEAMSAALITHIADPTKHVSEAERAFWNNKVSAYMDHTSEELLILSKTTYEDDNGVIQTI